MGLYDNSGYFTRNEKRSMMSRFLVVAGIFGLIIGIAAGSVGVSLFALACLATGGLATYREVQKRRENKRIAGEEAEIRAHNLRQARGQA